MVRSLLLDLDGTLVDTVPDLVAALNRLMQARGLAPFTRPQVASMVGDGVAVLVARAFAARNRQPDAAAIADFTADYEANVAVESRPFANVVEALTGLAAAGWTLAVCSNKPERAARTLLDRFGLLPLMSAVGGGDSFAVRKPDPGHLLGTLKLAGGNAAEAILLGDHRNDVLAATQAGMPCIFAAWGYGTADMADGSTAKARDIRHAVEIANTLRPSPAAGGPSAIR